MAEVVYETGGQELLDRIEPMWLALNEHQVRCSTDFSQAFQGRTMDSRRQRWVASGVNGLRIRMAILDGRDLGYCLSFIGGKMDAVLESLFVDEALRGRGVGLALARDALDWFGERGAKTIGLEVTVGNDHARDFYLKLGFKPFKLTMRLKR